MRHILTISLVSVLGILAVSCGPNFSQDTCKEQGGTIVEEHGHSGWHCELPED